MSPRAAVTAVFVLAGALTTSFFARLPSIQDRLELSNGEIGLALLTLTLALVVSQPLAGALAARRGSAPLLVASALLASAALAAPAFAGSFATLVAATAAIGAVAGMLDLTMNMQGVAVERRLGRPVLSGLHAAFSIGMLAAALAAGAAAAAGLSPRAHLLAAGALGVLSVLAVRPALLPAAVDAAVTGPLFARPSKALAAFGAIAFCVLLAEGAITDWSAIHLAQTLAASDATAAAGLAAFAAAMTLGRLAGDRITARPGAVAHLRGGALVAAVGTTVAATAPSVAVAVAGFALAGIGLSALFRCWCAPPRSARATRRAPRSPRSRRPATAASSRGRRSSASSRKRRACASRSASCSARSASARRRWRSRPASGGRPAHRRRTSR